MEATTTNTDLSIKHLSKFIRALQEATLIGSKPYLTFQQALMYLGVKKSFFFKKINDFHITTTPAGFYRKSDLDRIMSEKPETNKKANAPNPSATY